MAIGAPVDIKNQGISSLSIALVFLEYSSFSNKFLQGYDPHTLKPWGPLHLKPWGLSQISNILLKSQNTFSSTKVFQFLMNLRCHVHVSEFVCKLTKICQPDAWEIRCNIHEVRQLIMALLRYAPLRTMVSIGSGHGLVPIWRQANTWTKATLS